MVAHPVAQIVVERSAEVTAGLVAPGVQRWSERTPSAWQEPGPGMSGVPPVATPMGTEPTVVAAVVGAGVVVGPDGMAVLVPWLMEPVTPGAEVETVRDVAAEGRPVDPQPKVMARVTKKARPRCRPRWTRWRRLFIDFDSLCRRSDPQSVRLRRRGDHSPARKSPRKVTRIVRN